MLVRKFCQALSSINQSINFCSLISIFLNNPVRWIFKVCDESFCTWHQSKVSGDLQNYWSMTIFSKDLAKTSSLHYKLILWKNTSWCSKYPDRNFWSTSKIDYWTSLWLTLNVVSIILTPDCNLVCFIGVYPQESRKGTATTWLVLSDPSIFRATRVTLLVST